MSNDKTEEEFKEFFVGEHGDWLAVPWASDREVLAKQYGIEGIPAVVVVDKNGCVVEKDGRGKLVDCFVKARKGEAAAGGAEGAAELALFKEWKKAGGDWRETEGQSLGGASVANTDMDAMRAARLARLGGGGGGGGGPAAGAGAAAPAAAPPTITGAQAQALSDMGTMSFQPSAAAAAPAPPPPAPAPAAMGTLHVTWTWQRTAPRRALLGA